MDLWKKIFGATLISCIIALPSCKVRKGINVPNENGIVEQTGERLANNMPPEIKNFYDLKGNKKYSVALNSTFTFITSKNGTEFTDLNTNEVISLKHKKNNLYSDNLGRYILGE